MFEIKRRISKRDAARAQQQAPTISSQPRLPDISLPEFTGNYLQWSSFRELFTSLVLNNSSLSNVQRLHYLRASLKGAPAQEVSFLPLTGDSLKLSWELLTSRYENKRLIVQSHLDRLFSLPQLTNKSADQLSLLISTVSECCKALVSLGMTSMLGDCMLVHHVTKHLERATREAWETSIGASQEYPKFSELEGFLTTRARTLERIEQPPKPCSSRVAAPQRSYAAHASSQPKPHSSIAQPSSCSSLSSTKQQTAAHSYPCDCCKEAHYVVMCPKFRNLTVKERWELVNQSQLCHNCCGRHATASCRSQVRCKMCNGQHHTMLHRLLPSN